MKSLAENAQERFNTKILAQKTRS